MGDIVRADFSTYNKMSLRVTLLFLIVFLSVPIAFIKPYIGLLVFTWLAYMRPNDLAWGVESLSLYVAISIILGCLLNRKQLVIAKGRNFLLLFMLIMWIISMIFAYFPVYTLTMGVEFIKTLIIALITTSLIDNLKKIKLLIITIIFSFGLLAVKGTLQAIFLGWQITGPGGMISDNNDFGLALVMVIPLMYYMSFIEKRKILRVVYWVLFVFSILGVIYTYSRGSFIGLCCVIILLMLKSRRKVIGIIVVLLGIFIFINYAPQDYKLRIGTIKTYQSDESSMQRINSWKVAFEMFKERPFVGVGPGNFMYVYSRFDNVGGKPRVAHNSYLQLLAEAGCITLAIFIFLLLSTLWGMRSLRKRIKKLNENGREIHLLSHMIEVSLCGFIVSGFFLSRGDFDLLYQLVAISISLEMMVNQYV